MDAIKKLFFALLFIAICTPKLYAQDYINHYLTVDSAHYEYYVKKDVKATLAILQDESKKLKLDGGGEELMGHCLLTLGDSAGAVKYIKLSIAGYSFGADELKRVKNIFFGGSTKSSYYKEIESAFPELEKQYYSHQNIDVLIEIKTMMAKDQFVRLNKQSFDKEKGEKLARQVDSINIHRVKEIYEQYGADSIDGLELYVLIMHGINDFQDMWDYFQPRLLADIKKGEFSPGSYAYMFDRRRVIVEGKGSWFGVFTTDNFFDPQMGKIDDIENVDKRRREIGLGPLNQQAEMQHQTVPAGYKK